jgi:GntR family transcriptional regulator
MTEAHDAGGLPLYRHVYLILKERIGRDWPLGTQLLPELELAREFGVSRPTLRHALQIAQKEGLLVRRVGQGTFVDGVSTPTSHKVTGSFAHLLRFDKRVAIEVLPAADGSEAAPAMVEEARRLGIAEPRCIRRKALLEDRPFAYMENVVEHAALRRIDFKSLKRTPLAALIDADPKSRIAKVKEEIEAAIASPSLARCLGTPIGTALLRVQRMYFARGERLINLGTCWYLSDRYRFTVEMSRELGREKAE